MKKILILAGHLDDAVIAVGGIIKKITNNNGSVSVVCFGNGDEAFAKIEDRDTCVEKFKAQTLKAHEIMGITDFVCFDWPDFAVQDNRESYRKCIEAIRRVQPDVILGHYWLEYFQHRAMARLTCDSWWQAGWDCSADLGKPWATPKMYHYEVIQPLPEPTHIIDISDTFADKINALRQFDTAKDHLDPFMVQLESRARYHGSLIGVKYAEVLKQSFFIPQKVYNPTEEL